MPYDTIIAALMRDGTWQCIRCAQYGGLDGLLSTALHMHYASDERVEALMALGDILLLGASLFPPPDPVSYAGYTIAIERDTALPWRHQAGALRSDRFEADWVGRYRPFVYVWACGCWWIGRRLPTMIPLRDAIVGSYPSAHLGDYLPPAATSTP